MESLDLDRRSTQYSALSVRCDLIRRFQGFDGRLYFIRGVLDMVNLGQLTRK